MIVYDPLRASWYVFGVIIDGLDGTARDDVQNGSSRYLFTCTQLGVSLGCQDSQCANMIAVIYSIVGAQYPQANADLCHCT